MRNHNGQAHTQPRSAARSSWSTSRPLKSSLWSAADTLRSNSNYASNEYFMPVMGLIFLRHAYSRYLSVKDDIEANLPKRGGKTRTLAKEDFSRKSAIFLRTGSPVRLPGRLDGQRRPRQGDHRRDGIHRGRLRNPAGRAAQGRISGARQRRARAAPPHPQPRGAETLLRRRLRADLRILPDPVRRSQGARQRRVLHPGVPGLR